MEFWLDYFNIVQAYGRNMNNLCLMNLCSPSSVLLKYLSLKSECVSPPTFSQAMINGSISMKAIEGQEIPVLWK